MPEGVQGTDQAVLKGLPGFIPVLDKQEIERIILAKEIEEFNPSLREAILQVIKKVSDKEKKVIRIDYVTHTKIKELTWDSKAVIRTGEFQSYANIILVSSVTF